MFHLIYPTTCGARGHFSSINLKQQGSNIWHKIKKAAESMFIKLCIIYAEENIQVKTFLAIARVLSLCVHSSQVQHSDPAYKSASSPPCVYKADSNPKPSQKTGHESRTGV